MRQRTKQFLMDDQKIQAMLNRAGVGRLGVITKDNMPYIVPVNFVARQDSIYIHGAANGLKIESLRKNPIVCFEVDEEYGLRKEGPQTQCNVGEKYESVVAFGEANEVENEEEKATILKLFVDKYAPELGGLPMPAAMIAATAVVAIQIKSMTGKARG